MSNILRSSFLGEVQVWSSRHAEVMHAKLCQRSHLPVNNIDSRYLAYTDPNHPLLSKLEVLTPGTYRHSIMVGSMAATIAHKIGANADLVRAIGYFHDIGKMLHPDVFLESLSGSRSIIKPVSREDLNIILLHPIKSRLILEEYGFPEEICLAAEQHHGDMRSYVKLGFASDQPLIYTSFPPQSIESVLVMIADSVQSACARKRNSLDWEQKPSREFLNGIIRNVIDQLIEDEQFRNYPAIFSLIKEIRQTLMWWLFRYYNGLSTTGTPLADELSFDSPHMIRSNHRPKYKSWFLL